MYISNTGLRLYSELDKLVDTIKVNLNLDINDVPFSNLGIVKNFSKNNYSDTIEFLKLQISDMLTANSYSNKVKVGEISYNETDNLFIVNLDIDGNAMEFTMSGGE